MYISSSSFFPEDSNLIQSSPLFRWKKSIVLEEEFANIYIERAMIVIVVRSKFHFSIKRIYIPRGILKQFDLDATINNYVYTDR